MSDRRTRIVVVHRSAHHPATGGHAGGLDEMRFDEAVDGTTSRLPYRVRQLLALRAKVGYDSISAAREVDALRAAARAGRGRAHVHYLSAEHDVRWLPAVARTARWRTSAWFHKTPTELAALFTQRRGLRSLDVAVAIASNQLEVLARHVGQERVALLPYGVDTAWFTPPSAGSEARPCVLFFGGNLRSFTLADRVLERVGRERPEVDRVALVHPADLYRAPRSRGVEVLSEISDDDLVALVRRATVVIQPLEDAAANTAVLESMACGRAIVASDVGGIRDYLSPATAELVPHGDDAAFEEAVLALLDDEAQRDRLGSAARDASLAFDWREIADRFDALALAHGLSER